MKTTLKTLMLLLISSILTGCAVVRPGEAGVKQTLGKLSGNVLLQGPHLYNPFVTRVIITPVQTKNIEISLSLPSKEGLSVISDISILYRLEQEKLPQLIQKIGLDYEKIITNVFRSASADVCSRYFAKDMHSGMRSNIEKEIVTTMELNLKESGIDIEAVLLKSIKLPQGLSNSIEQKLQAEQDAMRMEFILAQEKLEAERKIIEAKGTSDAQKILSEGLTDQIIKIRSIEAFEQMSKSVNSKIIITNGNAPFLIDNGGK